MPQHKLLTKEIEKKLPPLYSGDSIQADDKVIQVKFFTPWTYWTWYATEYDPETRMFFGVVIGQETEWGYFSLDELQSIKSPLGLKIERDAWFPPITVREAAKQDSLLYGCF